MPCLFTESPSQPWVHPDALQEPVNHHGNHAFLAPPTSGVETNQTVRPQGQEAGQVHTLGSLTPGAARQLSAWIKE